MNTRSNSNRVYGLDILKALCSLGVILIHFPFPGKIGSCLVALSRVAVPVFFMITGYFYIDTQNQKCELVQIKKILRLCVFSNILYVLWGLIVEWKGDYTTFFYEIKDRYSFLEIFLFNGSPISGHLWYLNAILYVLVVVYFLSRVFSKHSERILLTLTPFLLLINQIFGNYAPLLLQREYPFVYCRNFLFRLSALVSKTQDIGKRPKYWTPKDVYWHQKEGVGYVQKESSELQPVYRTFFH